MNQCPFAGLLAVPGGGLFIVLGAGGGHGGLVD